MSSHQGVFLLARQPSIYSLTFDEFQSTMGGNGKDFGSMNLDELLKNIWSAEEIQTMGSNSVGDQEGGAPGGYLQRQGSLALPRTLSQKTVDEVWRDMSKECSGVGGSNLPQRQPTLGEMTLEEFLNMGLMGNMIPESSIQTAIQSANLPLNVNGFRSTQQQLPMSQPQQQLPMSQPQQQQQLFPKQGTLAYANPMPIPNSAQLSSPGMRGGIVGIAESVDY
ncbi:hypothetical protein F0562_027665 [Nyssa sinensis]|uniref:Uncharacterized protein n=1 Tax=Nyssa sinensis TaxID=561372 RepID=A0A5J5B366_9ASTE|nr:hypothetical protein F0562_027665 [Nyssa sinensis]